MLQESVNFNGIVTFAYQYLYMLWIFVLDYKKRYIRTLVVTIAPNSVIKRPKTGTQNNLMFVYQCTLYMKSHCSIYKRLFAVCYLKMHKSIPVHSKYRLVNLSRAPWDLVPREARHHIEWRVKGLPTYLVHDSHEKLNSYFLKFFYNPIISTIKC